VPTLYQQYLDGHRQEVDYDADHGNRSMFPIALYIDRWDGIDVPNEGADGICTITGDRFVDYLRLSFRWGGFPGWRNYENRPDVELKYLAEGLLEI
jgi:hypothetical protein